MTDVLSTLKPPELAAFYRRVADAVDSNRGKLEISLAALFMRHWLENRDPAATFQFDAPEHLRTCAPVQEVLAFHRRVFLTQEKARFTGGVTKWAGIVPRLIGKSPFPKWDTNRPLSMDYESLVEVPLRYQITGTDGDRDILYSLRGFQLRSSVIIAAVAQPQGGKVKVKFQSYRAEARDRYDWDYSEHLTVPNPDFGSKRPGAVAAESKTVVVYHSNAKRLEDAGLAAPYDLHSNSWQAMAAALGTPVEVDATPRD